MEDVWRKSIDDDPDDAPGQEEVIQLLGQMYHANLLHFDLPADSEKLFEHYKERKQSLRYASIRSIMFFRILLSDPNGPPRRLEPLIGSVVNPAAAALCGVAIMGTELFIAAMARLSGPPPDKGPSTPSPTTC